MMLCLLLKQNMSDTCFHYAKYNLSCSPSRALWFGESAKLKSTVVSFAWVGIVLLQRSAFPELSDVGLCQFTLKVLLLVKLEFL